MTRGREVTGRNRWIEGERSVRDLELSGTVRAFRRERGGVCACALEGGAFHSAHRAVVGSPFAAACGQARLRTGRNDLHDRPQAVQENEANAHNPAHGAPLMPSPLDRKSLLGPFPFLPDSAVVRTNRLRTSSSFYAGTSFLQGFRPRMEGGEAEWRQPLFRSLRSIRSIRHCRYPYPRHVFANGPELPARSTLVAMQ